MRAPAAASSPRALLRRYNVLATFLITMAFATVATSGLFLDAQNLLNVGERASVVGIVALGQMLVILTAGIDLSVGGLIAVALLVLSKASGAGLPVPLAVLLAILAGMGAGAINGLLISRTRVPPFMITLGTMLFWSSFTLYFTGAAQLEYYRLQRYFNETLMLSRLGARLFPTVSWLVLSAVLIFVLGRTRFGHNVYAVGGKERAAEMSGIRTRSVKLAVYTLSGLFCAVAGVVLAYRLAASNPDIGSALLMEAIAAAVVGGTNINGGEGSIYGTLIGAIIMAALVNVLNLLQANPYIQEAIKGLMLVGFVVMIQVFSRRR